MKTAIKLDDWIWKIISTEQETEDKKVADYVGLRYTTLCIQKPLGSPWNMQKERLWFDIDITKYNATIINSDQYPEYFL